MVTVRLARAAARDQQASSRPAESALRLLSQVAHARAVCRPFRPQPEHANKITDWLLSQGFPSSSTARGRNFIVFSGTAAQVEKTFQIQIHNFKINGRNSFPPHRSGSDSGRSLWCRRGFPRSQQLPRPYPGPRAMHNYTFNIDDSTYYFLAPGDIATMYDSEHTYTNGINGTGQAIAVIGQTDIYLTISPTSARLSVSLPLVARPAKRCNHWPPAPSTSPTSCTGEPTPARPTPSETICPRPISTSNGPVRPLAARKSSSSTPPTRTADGIYDSWYYAIDNNVAPVMTMSYSLPCELAEAGTFDGEYTIPGMNLNFRPRTSKASPS